MHSASQRPAKDIFDPFFNAYRVVGEILGKAFSDGLKLK